MSHEAKTGLLHRDDWAVDRAAQTSIVITHERSSITTPYLYRSFHKS